MSQTPRPHDARTLQNPPVDALAVLTDSPIGRWQEKEWLL